MIFKYAKKTHVLDKIARKRNTVSSALWKYCYMAGMCFLIVFLWSFGIVIVEFVVYLITTYDITSHVLPKIFDLHASFFGLGTAGGL